MLDDKPVWLYPLPIHNHFSVQQTYLLQRSLSICRPLYSTTRFKALSKSYFSANFCEIEKLYLYPASFQWRVLLSTYFLQLPELKLSQRPFISALLSSKRRIRKLVSGQRHLDELTMYWWPGLIFAFCCRWGLKNPFFPSRKTLWWEISHFFDYVFSLLNAIEKKALKTSLEYSISGAKLSGHYPTLSVSTLYLEMLDKIMGTIGN